MLRIYIPILLITIAGCGGTIGIDRTDYRSIPQSSFNRSNSASKSNPSIDTSTLDAQILDATINQAILTGKLKALLVMCGFKEEEMQSALVDRITEMTQSVGRQNLTLLVSSAMNGEQAVKLKRPRYSDLGCTPDGDKSIRKPLGV